MRKYIQQVDRACWVSFPAKKQTRGTIAGDTGHEGSFVGYLRKRMLLDSVCRLERLNRKTRSRCKRKDVLPGLGQRPSDMRQPVR